MFQGMPLRDLAVCIDKLRGDNKASPRELRYLFLRLWEIVHYEHDTTPSERELALRFAEDVFKDLERAYRNDPENLKNVYAARQQSEANARRFGYGSLFWLSKEQRVAPEDTIPFWLRVEHGHLLKDLLDSLPREELLSLRPEMVRELLRTRRLTREEGNLVILNRLAREHDPATRALFNEQECGAFESAYQDAGPARAVLISLGLIP